MAEIKTNNSGWIGLAVIAVLVFVCWPRESRQPNTDKEQLPKAPAEQAIVLIEQADAFYNQQSIGKGKESTESALRIASALLDANKVAEAEPIFLKIRSQMERVGKEVQPQYPHCLVRLADCYIHEGTYSKAEDLYLFILKGNYCSSQNDTESYKHCVQALADIYHDKRDYERSAEWYEELLSCRNKAAASTSFDRSKITAILNLDQYYEKASRWPDVERICNMFVAEERKTSPVDKHNLAIALWKLAYALNKQEKYSQAIIPATEARQCYKELAPKYAHESKDCAILLAYLQFRTQTIPQVLEASRTTVSAASATSHPFGSCQSVSPARSTEAAPAATFPSRVLGVGGVYISTGSGHWISENHDGEIIQLEDSSLWRVSPGDEIDARLWLPVSNITVVESRYGPGYMLINTDDNEKVLATLLQQ